MSEAEHSDVIFLRVGCISGYAASPLALVIVRVKTQLGGICSNVKFNAKDAREFAKDRQDGFSSAIFAKDFAPFALN